MEEIFTNVFRDKKRLYTSNLVKGERVYGETLTKFKAKELREWAPYRSKVAACLANGLSILPLNEGDVVLYLGAATGTTVSHISDIVGREGLVYAVEFSERVIRNLLDLARQRNNIVPMLVDARLPNDYLWVEQCHALFCDVAQPDATEIAMRNFDVFIEKGFLFLSVKSQSIDVTKDPKKLYEEELNKLKENGFIIVAAIDLEPFEEKHMMVVAQKK